MCAQNWNWKKEVYQELEDTKKQQAHVSSPSPLTHLAFISIFTSSFSSLPSFPFLHSLLLFFHWNSPWPCRTRDLNVSISAVVSSSFPGNSAAAAGRSVANVRQRPLALARRLQRPHYWLIPSSFSASASSLCQFSPLSKGGCRPPARGIFPVLWPPSRQTTPIGILAFFLPRPIPQ